MRKEEIERKAKEVYLEYKESHPDSVEGIDVVELARDLGFHVGEVEFKDDTEGIILVDTHQSEIMGRKTSKLIMVAKERTRAEKRFIIAHELGHYFLDQNKSDDGRVLVAARDAKHGRSKAENEFDYFAACLLMPEEKFRKMAEVFSKLGFSEESVGKYLAELFNVPFGSAMRRMKEVGAE